MKALLSRLGGVDWAQTLTAWSLRLAGGLAILIFGLWLVRWLMRLARRGLDRARIEAILRDFLVNIARTVLVVVVVLAALDFVGVPTTSLLAVVGAAGLAVGLALRDSLTNLASGVMLITLRPFHAGDSVQIAGQEGVVEQVRLFQTVLRTYSNHEVTLPNGQITASPIVNLTARAQRRIEIPVGIAYEAEVQRAREILLRITNDDQRVLPSPASEVLVTELGDNSVGLLLRTWVNTPDFVHARSDLVEAIHRELGKAGIGIPFPQREVHLKLPEGTVIRVPRTDSPGRETQSGLGRRP